MKEKDVIGFGGKDSVESVCTSKWMDAGSDLMKASDHNKSCITSVEYERIHLMF